MPLKKTKKTVAIAVSLSMIANLSPHVYASDLVAFPQNNTSVIIPPNSSIVQSNSTEFSMKSIEDKINNVLNPDKKEESKEAKLLVDDDSGSCGDGVTYTFTTSTGELKISGTGDMSSYSSPSSVPWYSYRSSITSLVIESGVTSIGKDAFYFCSGVTGSLTIPSSVTSIGDFAFFGCSGLTSITIPDSVTSIGYSAFNHCSGLTGSLTIPNGVTSIGDSVFSFCSGLTSVTIPASVTSIGSDAFQYCSGLTSVTIPASVTSIGRDAFHGCSGLTSINVDENNTSFKSIDGILYSNDGKTLIQCPGGKTGEVTIPDSVTSIGSYAFSSCYGLTSVTIGNGVTEIGDFAFAVCSGLIGQLTIPDSVTSIGSHAFYRCSGLTSITIPDSVTSIGNSAFDDCSGLTSINVDENNTSFKSIDGILYSSDGKTLIQCPAGKTGSISIPDSVTKIRSDAFFGCSGLTGSLTIPSSVTSIGSLAFYGCSGLTSITIPDSVTSIDSDAFYGCSGLTSINVDENNTSFKSIDGILYSNDGTTLIQCPGSKTGSISIPDSVTSIDSDAFYGCSGLTSINVDENNTSFKSIDGILYSNDGTTLIQCPGSKTGSIFIPDSVTKIGYSAFEGCSSLTSVTIPDSVQTIGSHAFYRCSGLTSVTIGNGITNIYDYTFYGCSGLTSVTYKGTSDPGASYTNVFDGCNLKAVNVPSNYTNKTFCGLPIKKPATNPFTSFDYPIYFESVFFLTALIFSIFL